MRNFTLFLLLCGVDSLFAQKLEPSVGFYLGYNHSWDFQVETGTVANQKFRKEVSGALHYALLGGFFDLTFVDFTVDGAFSFGEPTISTTTEQGSNKIRATTFPKTFLIGLNLALHGKYPFALGRGIEIFPLLGVAYHLNLVFSDTALNINKNDLTEQQKMELNELYLEGGVSLNWAINNTVYLRPVFLIGYNFLAATEAGKQAAQNANLDYFAGGLKLGVNVGVGFKL